MSQNVMRLDSILADLDDTFDKTAEEEADSKGDSEEEDKSKDGKKAIFEALKATKKKDDDYPADPKEKEEKVASPTSDLQKIANDVLAAEEEALIKEAQLYGASVADGFMNRISLYEKVAEDLHPQGNSNSSIPLSSLNKHAEQLYHDDEGNTFTESQVKEAQEELYREEKLASSGGYSPREQFSPGYVNNRNFDVEPEAIKIAEEIIEEASANGYHMSGEEALEKVAQQAFEAGYNDTMEKAAGESYNQGYNDTLEKAAEVAYSEGFEQTLEKAAQILHEAGQTEAVQSLEKAAFDSGYEDTMEKIASSAFEQGVADMDNIIKQIA